MIPADWKKLILEYDDYRKLWIGWAIAPRSDEVLWWFKGTGESPEAAFTDLSNHVKLDKHMGVVPAASAYIKGAVEKRLPKELELNIDIGELDL